MRTEKNGLVLKASKILNSHRSNFHFPPRVQFFSLHHNLTSASLKFYPPIMCGRFTRMYTWRELIALYRLTDKAPPSNLQPRYNICPTAPVDAVVLQDDKRTLQSMRWGLIPNWWSKPLKEMKLATFNARAETVAEKPMFRSAFKRNRCLMPASGYYEWHDTPEGKQPYYFTRRDGQVMTIAALWDEWMNKAEGEKLQSCCMVIMEPNKFVAEVQ